MLAVSSTSLRVKLTVALRAMSAAPSAGSVPVTVISHFGAVVPLSPSFTSPPSHPASTRPASTHTPII